MDRVFFSRRLPPESFQGDHELPERVACLPVETSRPRNPFLPVLSESDNHADSNLENSIKCAIPEIFTPVNQPSATPSPKESL
jgi:hypothetical protein